MPLLTPIKHWFQKRVAALGWSAVASEQRTKYNALLGADPDRLIAAITAFDAGSLGTLARMIEAYELRDDKMKTGSMKMKAAVARCDYSVMPLEGFEKDARATRHVECLKRFWSSVRATDAFKRNERGGFALLAKQMMDAQSYGFAVHELVWTPLASGELGCTFVKVPLWHFENHTGELRFLKSANDYEGEQMREGEWLVSTGDGVGIAAALCACIKRMSLADWLVFSERCGMPLLHGTTGAAFGSEQWNNLNAALAAIGRDTRVLTDLNSKIEAIPLGGGASTPFPPLVEWADRAIAALYRGADLSTMSRGDDAVGASVQEGETSILEQDACNRLSDALHEQIDRFVIRYVFGEEPLARIWIEPISKPDVDTDIKVDEHLARLGVKLSKREALQRYGRTEAEDDNDALELRETPPQGGFAGFANEATPKPAPKPLANRLQNAPGNSDAQGEVADAPALLGPFLRALADDCKPLAKEVEDILKNPTPEKAKELLAKLPDMCPSDPTLAPLLAEEMAKAYGEAWNKSHTEAQRHGEDLANEIANPCPKCHRNMPTGGTCSFCAKRAANHTAGKAAFAKVADTHQDVVGAMERDAIGKIDFIWGNDSEGVCHILSGHNETANQIPGVIAYGDVYENSAEGKFYIVKKRYVAVLRKQTGSNHYLITGFRAESPNYVANIRKEHTLVEKGE